MPGQRTDDHHIIISIAIDVGDAGKSPFPQLMPSANILTEACDGFPFVIEDIDTFPTCDDNIFLSVVVHVSNRNMWSLHEITFWKSFFEHEFGGVSFVYTDADKNIIRGIASNVKPVKRLDAIITRVIFKKHRIFYI